MEKTDYSKYSDIKIISLSFLWGHSRNKACYNRLVQNNALTLQSVFEKYDSDSFVFPEHDKEANAQTRAIIELIRFKYLKTNLLLDVFLEQELVPFVITRNDNKVFIETIKLLRSIGLERRQASGLAKYISKYVKEPIKLGDFLTDFYYKNHRISNISMNELDDLRIKLSLLVDYYTKRKNNEIKDIPLNHSSSNEIKPTPIDMTDYISRLQKEKNELLRKRSNIDQKLSMIESELSLLQTESQGKKL